MSAWLTQARALFRRDLLIDLRHRLVYLYVIGEAALALISYAFLARVFGASRPDGYEPLAFLLVGIALTDSLTTSVVYLSQGVRSNQQTGTLKALLAMPISPMRLMWLSMPYPAVRAAVDFLLFLGVAIALGLPAAGINVAASAVVFILAVLAMTGPAVVSAAFAVAFKRGDPVRWVLGSATWLLSGVLYPTGVLPSFLQGVAWCLPTTHALTAIRATVIDGASLSRVGRDVSVLAGFTLIGMPISLWLFSQAVAYARREVRSVTHERDSPDMKKKTRSVPDGTAGWDEYAAFYDWENAQTVGRRDVAFWQSLARRTRGKILELGAGTGRLTLPLVRVAGKRVVGIDRSMPMLSRAVAKLRRAKSAASKSRRHSNRLFLGDIRALPFADQSFTLVIAPYGMLQSLTRERDLKRALAEAARVLAPGGVLGVDLVPDLPTWDEYKKSVRFRGRMGASSIRLIESVRQDRKKGLTIFDQEFVETRRGERPKRRRFSLAFRTLPVPKVVTRLEKAGFDVQHMLGDYRGGEWDERADVWLLLARRC